MKTYVSLRIFWVFLIVFFSAFGLLVWFWLIPYENLEYNLGVDLFSSSIFMVLTIISLNVLLDAREKSEWKTVKNYVYKSIQCELGIVFNAILDYVENGSAISMSLLHLQDGKPRNENGLSELQKLKDAKELKLDSVRLASLLEHKNQLEIFLDVSKNLSEVEIKYSRFLLPQLTLSLMEIRDCLRLLEIMAQLPTFKNLSLILNTPMPKEIQEMKDNIQDLKDGIPKITSAIISVSFKKILEEIYNIHKMGIEFSPYPR